MVCRECGTVWLSDVKVWQAEPDHDDDAHFCPVDGYEGQLYEPAPRPTVTVAESIRAMDTETRDWAVANGYIVEAKKG